MATKGSDFESDEIPDQKCFTCKNAAVKFCVECQVYLCQSCVNFHKLIPATQGHTLLDNFVFSESKQAPTVPTKRCSIHVTKLVDMYCKDHDDVGCTTCMALKHRSCANVHSVPDDIDKLCEDFDKNDIIQRITICKKALQEVILTKDEALECLDMSRKRAEMAVENAKAEILSHVEKLERKSKDEINSKYENAKAQIEDEKRKANKHRDDIRTIKVDLETSAGNKSQQFVSMKIANRKLKEADDKKLALRCSGEANISFNPDSSIHTFVRDIKTFGRVTCTTGTVKYIVETINDMNVKLQDDSSTCDIFDSCLLNDGTLLLTDNSNKKLKRVNIDTLTVVSVCCLDNSPYSLCSTGKDEAVVTFYRYYFIQFVTISAKLKPSRKVNINHKCLRISCKDDKLYITDNAQTIYIHDMTGNELQKISTDSSGNSLFSYVRDINLSDSTPGIIVVDFHRGVIILNDQYQFIARYCDSDLKYASSICTDGRGNIFVCGWSSNNVLLIGYDGSMIGCVVDSSHGIQHPRSVRFDSNRRRLIVTQHSDIVKIIELK